MKVERLKGLKQGLISHVLLNNDTNCRLHLSLQSILLSSSNSLIKASNGGASEGIRRLGGEVGHGPVTPRTPPPGSATGQCKRGQVYV